MSKMLLPQDLQQAIERVYTEMITHPERALIPIHRHAIYDLLHRGDPSHNRLTFKWLAVITARFVLPIWQVVRPNDSMLEHLVNIAEGVINGTVSTTLARDTAGKAWEQLEILGAMEEGKALGNAFYSNASVVEALMEVLGHDPFKDIIINEHDLDSVLDPWCSDTALWAVVAYAGRIGEAGSDSAKREKFWCWWLREAIPTALNTSGINTIS